MENTSKLTREEILEAIRALKLIKPQSIETKKKIQKLQQEL